MDFGFKNRSNISWRPFFLVFNYRGGVGNTRLEAEAKDTKKIRGQGQEQPFRGQTLSRPRTGMLEAKVKDQGYNAEVISKKRNIFAWKIRKFSGKFRRSPKKKGPQKVFRKLSGVLQNETTLVMTLADFQQFNKRCCPPAKDRTGHFRGLAGFEAKDLTIEAKAKDFKLCPRGLHLCSNNSDTKTVRILGMDLFLAPDLANFWLCAC